MSLTLPVASALRNTRNGERNGYATALPYSVWLHSMFTKPGWPVGGLRKQAAIRAKFSKALHEAWDQLDRELMEKELEACRSVNEKLFAQRGMHRTGLFGGLYFLW